MKHNLLSLTLFLPLLASLQTPIPKGSEQPTTCNLAAPATLNSQVTGSTTADLSWSAVSGAYAYFLVVTDNGAPFLQTSVSGTSRILGGLTSGHTYHCTVAGMCDGSQTSSYIIALDIMP